MGGVDIGGRWELGHEAFGTGFREVVSERGDTFLSNMLEADLADVNFGEVLVVVPMHGHPVIADVGPMR